MDSFWKWLMRANAKAVFFTAFAALAIVTAWWIWRSIKPVEQEPPLPPSAFLAEKPVVLGMDLTIEQLQLRAPSEIPKNVFGAPEYRPPPSPQDRNTAVAVQAPLPQQSPQPHARKRDLVTLTYRGILQRPDGKIVALVQNSKTQASTFYSVSNDVFGAVITAVATNEATLTLGDGESIQIKAGESIVLEGGKLAK